MLILPADQAHFKALKQALRAELPTLASSQAGEALAAGAGFRTYAALKAALPSQIWEFQEERLRERLHDFLPNEADSWTGWTSDTHRHPLWLGFHADQLHQISTLPTSGCLLIGGTAGQGKTSTLQSLMAYSRANNPKPLRAFHPSSTENFGAIMRAEPDQVILGEIRNEQGVRLLAHLVRSGAYVASTILAGSLFALIERLRAFGLSERTLNQPHFFDCLIHQKLIPILCPHCARPYNAHAHPDLHARLNRVLPANALGSLRMRGDGCSQCAQTNGWVGRTICAQVMRVPLGQTLSDQLSIREKKSTSLLSPHQANMGPTVLAHARWKMTRGMIDPHDLELAIGPVDQDV